MTGQGALLHTLNASPGVTLSAPVTTQAPQHLQPWHIRPACYPESSGSQFRPGSSRQHPPLAPSWLCGSLWHLASLLHTVQPLLATQASRHVTGKVASPGVRFALGGGGRSGGGGLGNCTTAAHTVESLLTAEACLQVTAEVSSSGIGLAVCTGEKGRQQGEVQLD